MGAGSSLKAVLHTSPQRASLDAKPFLDGANFQPGFLLCRVQAFLGHEETLSHTKSLNSSLGVWVNLEALACNGKFAG